MKKKIFITGASSGIGFATAKWFLDQGHSCGLLARRAQPLHQLQQSFSTKAQVFVCDLAAPTQRENFLAQNQTWLSDVDVFVNNAGLALGVAPVQNAQWSDWHQMLETNVGASFYLALEIAKLMAQRKKGHIINIGSVAAHTTYPGGNMYAATKAALHSLTESLRMDLAGTGVRVTTIAPGMVETEFSEVRLGDKFKAAQVYQGMRPLTGVDVARTIGWVTEQPEHVNVQEIILFPTDQAAVGQVTRR